MFILFICVEVNLYIQGPRAKGQGPRAKGQGPRAKGQGPRAKGLRPTTFLLYRGVGLLKEGILKGFIETRRVPSCLYLFRFVIQPFFKKKWDFSKKEKRVFIFLLFLKEYKS